MKKEKTIYDLELHESISKGLIYTRVSGGWIVRSESRYQKRTPVFVPYNSEFQEPKKKRGY